jgi:hypothetical protein
VGTAGRDQPVDRREEIRVIGSIAQTWSTAEA